MYSVFSHAPAAAEQKDFTSTCLCLISSPHPPKSIYTPHPSLCSLGRPYPLVAKTWPFSPRFTDPTALSAQLLFPHWPSSPTPTPKPPPSKTGLLESHELTRALFNTHTYNWNQAAFSSLCLVRAHFISSNPPIRTPTSSQTPSTWVSNSREYSEIKYK